MSRVEIATQPWGYLVDTAGNPQAGVSATLKNLDATNATTWTAVTGGTSNTSAIVSASDGTLGRYVEQGTYTLTVGATTRRVEATLGGTPQNLDAGVAAGTNLTLLRNNSSNTNVLAFQSSQTGGRTTVAYRREDGTDIARLVAHTAADTVGVVSGWRVYTQRLTPRLDGLLVDNRFTIEADSDFASIQTFSSSLIINTHDTDNNLYTDQLAVQIQRSPSDNVNEKIELLRSRTSSVGSNYFYRNLAAADTAGPLIRVLNDNVGDDQIALKVTQDCATSALEVTNTAGGPAVDINGGYIEIVEQTDPAAPAADNLRLFAKDQGSGLTVLALRTSSGTLNIYGSIAGTATWDPASIADGAQTNTTVTATGAAIGDMVTVGFSNAVAGGAFMVGQVTAANTVTVTLFNKTGGALDLASGTLRVQVSKIV